MADQPDEHKPGTTQDEQLLESPGPDEFTNTDTWRVFRIMGEFVTGFVELATLSSGVSIFVSARNSMDDPDYQSTQETASMLAKDRFAVLNGTWLGIMEQANMSVFCDG